MHAIRKWKSVAVLAFLIRGADVNLADNAGITPLMAAVGGIDDDIQGTAMDLAVPSILIAYGADITITDVSAKTVFHYAARAHMVSHIPIEYSQNINDLDADGNTAFHYGIFSLSQIEALLERGADASIPNKDGRTVIHLLSALRNSWTGFYEIRTILDKNPEINLNLQDSLGNTALDLAEDPRIKRCLIAKGAIYSDGRVPTTLPDLDLFNLL